MKIDAVRIKEFRRIQEVEIALRPLDFTASRCAIASESDPAPGHAPRGDVPIEAPPAYEPRRSSPDAPALERMEERQRLLDTAAAESESPPPDLERAAAPVVTTPFPRIGSDTGRQ